MDRNFVKNFGFIALLGCIVVGVLVVVLVHYKHEATKIVKTLEAERYNRLVAEEKVVTSVSKIKQLESDLKSNEEKFAKIQSVLKEQKSFNQDLENQFERLSRAKTALEEQLKTVINPPVTEQVNQTVPSN